MRSNVRERLPVFALLLAVACGGGKKGDTEKPGMGPETGEEPPAAENPLPTVPSSPAPLPPAVLAALSVGEPQARLANLAAFADAVQPGFGAMVAPAQLLQGLAGTVGAPGLDGADLTKPLHLLFLDPQKGGGQALLVVAVADQQKMTGTVGGGALVQFHAGYAAVGSPPAIQAASAYALSNVAKSTPPAQPHGVIYVNRIVESYGAQIDGVLRQSLGSSPQPAEKLVAEAMVKVLSSVERIEADLDAGGQAASAVFSVFPKQGSTLAEWAGLQKPSDYSAASRLPAGQWLAVGAGRLDWTPLKGFFAEVAQAQGQGEMPDWLGVLAQEWAFAFLAKEDKTVRIAAIFGISDAKKLGQLMTDYVKKAASQPTPMNEMQVVGKANAYKTGGVSLHSITIQPGPQTPEDEKKEYEKTYGKVGLRSYFGAAGEWMVATFDRDKGSKELAAKLVQSAKAKQPKSSLTASFEKGLADSKARTESGVLIFDLSVLASDPAKAQGAEVALGFGVEGPAFRTRLSLTPATVRFFVQQQMRPSPGATP